MKNHFSFLILFLLYGHFTISQNLPSFPGAEGFGAGADGGRGGPVIYVTNLNAAGPGSFNDALAVPGKKYILFKVSGLIDAAAELVYGDATIAGQTSPGGIIVRGFVIDEVYDTIGTGDNIIIRHIRSRPRDPVDFPSPNFILDDAFRLDGARNVIADHCSFANAIDECVQISQSSKITIQNTSLAETIGDHYYLGGMLMNYSTPEHPQDSISIHHNVWNRLGGRLPELSCESPYCSSRSLNLELSDNLIWDETINVWYNSGIDPTAPAPIDSFFMNLNLINNLGFSRSSFTNGMFAHNLLELGANSIYANGNHLNIFPAYSDYDLFYCCNDFDQTGNNPNTDLGIANILSNRHPFPVISYTPSSSLINYIYTNNGAFPRDSMDRRLFSPLHSGIIDLTPIDTLDHYGDAFLADFSTISPPPSPLDSDDDGMPDYWEASHGLNPSVQDHNGTSLSLAVTGVAGYTNLECYLNCLSDFLVNGSSASPCGILAGMDVLQNSNKSQIDVFPNPVADLLTIDASALFTSHVKKQKIEDVKVYTILGEKIVFSQPKIKSSQEFILDFSDQPSGIYFIRIRTTDDMLTKKIIKR